MRTATAMLTAFAATTAHAQWDIDSYFNDDQSFGYWAPGIPDFDQVRSASPWVAGLPNDGSFYCAPTAAISMLAWVANHGYPNLRPYPQSWQDFTVSNWDDASRLRYNEITDAITLMAAPANMNTSATTGTALRNQLHGIRRYLALEDPVAYDVFRVTHTGTDGIQWDENRVWFPRIVDAAFAGHRGSVMLARWGYYSVNDLQDGTPVDIIQRTGGHIVSVERIERYGPDTYLTVRNPGSGDSRFSQGDFQSGKWRVELVTLDDTNGNPVDREVLMRPTVTFSDFNPGMRSHIILDGFTHIRPRGGFSVGHTTNQIEYHDLMPNGQGGITISTTPFTLPVGESVAGAEWAVDSRYAYVATTVTTSSFGTIYAFDRALENWQPIESIEYIRDLRVRDDRTLTVLSNTHLHAVNPYDDQNPLQNSTLLPYEADLFDVNNESDEVVVLNAGGARLDIFDADTFALLDQQDLPLNIYWNDATDLAVSPIDSAIWLPIGDTVIRVVVDNGSGMRLDQFQMSATVDFISIDELGQLYLSLDDGPDYSVSQFIYDETENELVELATSPYAGLNVGPGFTIETARNNTPDELFNQPGSAQLPVDTILATFVPPEPPDPRDLCGLVDDFESNTGPDGQPITTRNIGPVTITYSSATGDPLEWRTYTAGGLFGFRGRDAETNKPWSQIGTSGDRFITTSRSSRGGFNDVEPLIFELSTPVRSFALTTVDLLENRSFSFNLTLRAFDDTGAVVAEHTRPNNQGPSGIVLNWLVDSPQGDIVRVELASDLPNWPGTTGYAIDDVSICLPVCRADHNRDDLINTGDFIAYLNDFNDVMNGGTWTHADPDLAPPYAVVNTADFLEFLNQYNDGCP